MLSHHRHLAKWMLIFLVALVACQSVLTGKFSATPAPATKTVVSPAATAIPCTPAVAPTPIATYQDIPLFGSPSENASYTTDSLDWLRQSAPKWWAYIMAARPFYIQLTPVAAVTWSGGCCDSRGFGSVTINSPSLAGEAEADEISFEIDRAFFLSNLIHEVTHIRDWRAGKAVGYVRTPANPTCNALEFTAYREQIAVLSDLLKVELGQPELERKYVADLQAIINGREQNLAGFVAYSCGASTTVNWEGSGRSFLVNPEAQGNLKGARVCLDTPL